MSKLSITAKPANRLQSLNTQALVVLTPRRKSLPADVKELDQLLGKTISRAIKGGDFEASPGAHLWLPGTKTVQRVLLIGCGEPNKLSRGDHKKITDTVARLLTASPAKDAVIDLCSLGGVLKEAPEFLELLASSLIMGVYQYDHTLSERKKPARPLRKVIVQTGATCELKIARPALAAGAAIGEGANLTRELVNLPGNICTPKYLSAQARQLAKQHERLTVTVLDEGKMAELGMHSLLSVGNGSEQPSQLIVLKYQGGSPKEQPFCLVGKGITFDTGGISLKPGAKMDEMKFDMGGAGSVFGAIHAASTLKLPINIIGVIAAAENMPSGRATKPGDVVTSLSGKTIEILNTDAEGRLVLCDALTYVSRFSPREVVDIATLTGAIIISLGNEATGVFSNDEPLARALLEAGNRSHDRAWQFPIWEEYTRQLDSPFADLANIGSGGAGSITAACFLSQFTQDYRWAHLDIAGTAFRSAPKGATGRPVSLLVNYLRERAGSL